MEVRHWGLLRSLLVTAGRSRQPPALRGAESPQASGLAKTPCLPQSGLCPKTRSQGGIKTWHPYPDSGLVRGAVPASRRLRFGPRPAWTLGHSPASLAAAFAPPPAPPSPAAGGNPGTGRPSTASETRPVPPQNPGASPSTPPSQFPAPRSSVSLPQGSPLGLPACSQGLAALGCHRLGRPPPGAHLRGCSRVDHYVCSVMA